MRLKMNMTLRAERPEEIKKTALPHRPGKKKGTVKKCYF
jgi:hypothetical protein